MGADGPRRRDFNPWRLTALLLLAVATAAFGMLVAAAADEEVEASAVLRTRVRAGDSADALRSPEVLRAIARSTGAPMAELRDDLSITEADGFRLALRYQPEAPAGARRVATESVRRVVSVLLDDALTRADRALVAAQSDGGGVHAAERVAQDARDARAAAFDVRVEATTVRPAWWTAGLATVTVLLLIGVAACVPAARPRRWKRTLSAHTPTSRRRPRTKTPPAPERTESATPALSLEELEQQLLELTRRTAGAERVEAEVSA